MGEDHITRRGQTWYEAEALRSDPTECWKDCGCGSSGSWGQRWSPGGLWDQVTAAGDISALERRKTMKSRG